MSKVKTVRFNKPIYLQTSRDAAEFAYPFVVEYIIHEGKPEEKLISESFRIMVGISGTLATMWGYGVYDNSDLNILKKFLYEHGKRKVIKKIKDNTLNVNEELILLTNNSPQENPYNPDKIEEPNGAIIKVEIPENDLVTKMKEDVLAASIVETMDNINSIFYLNHKEKLLQPDQLSNIVDLFRPVKSRQDFSHSIASLSHMATAMNTGILRKLTSNDDPDKKSIYLLEQYLIFLHSNNEKIISTLKNLNRIRQGYPIHTDIAEGVIKSYRYFGLDHPVEDFEKSWKILMNAYLEILKDIFVIFKDKLKL